MPLGMPALSPSIASICYQSLTNIYQQQAMPQVLGFLSPKWEIWFEFQAPGIVLALTDILELTSKRRIDLPTSLFQKILFFVFLIKRQTSVAWSHYDLCFSVAMNICFINFKCKYTKIFKAPAMWCYCKLSTSVVTLERSLTTIGPTRP